MIRQFVPFDALWNMAIDVPYSFLVREGSRAWSCGQLAMDGNAEVMFPGDLVRQSQVVCNYIREILERGGITTDGLTRLLLYYVHSTQDEQSRMTQVFRDHFGDGLIIDLVPVPHFYYDGIVLEVDLFSGGPAILSKSTSAAGGCVQVLDDGETAWISLDVPDVELKDGVALLSATLQEHGLKPDATLSEHWFVPTPRLDTLCHQVEGLGQHFDHGAIIGTGQGNTIISGRFTLLSSTAELMSTEMTEIEGVRTICRSTPRETWIQARVLSGAAGLVEQTRCLMPALERELQKNELTFDDVVKSTTHYVGGESEEDLHDNMRVRNRYYHRPGPASTGLPVFGFAEKDSRIVIDITAKPRS